MNSSFFDRIGLADMEKVHSAIIGWLFSENCQVFSLQQKSELLCNFFNVEKQIFQDIRVKVELYNIDILILTDEDTPKAACWVIENKVKSSQHSNQLDKYVKIVNGEKVKIGNSERVISDYKNYKSKHYCFLTLVNEAPHNQIWKNCTYKKLADLLSNMSLSRNNDSAILCEYIKCIKNLSEAVEVFLDEHQNYLNVFTDGSKKKVEKINKMVSTQNKTIRDYIAENGLETIFQKCFLSLVNQKAKKWKYDYCISETHGIALIEYQIDKLNEISYSIQIQNGTFKVQVLGVISDKKDEAVRNQFIVAFWESWEKILKKDKFEGWTINKSKGQNKPYFSISKNIDKNWYNYSVDEIANKWDLMYDECMAIYKQLRSD